MYNDNSSFLYRARQTVYKWWCVVYKPAYKLFHNGYWPAEKEPYYKASVDNTTSNVQSEQSKLAQDMAQQILSQQGQQENVDTIINNTEELTTPTESIISEPKVTSQEPESTEPEVDLSSVDQNTLDRANEIMARLAREAAEDEAKKQAEIDSAKAKAAEEARLANILKSTKVDISAYIEEGMASRDNE